MTIILSEVKQKCIIKWVIIACNFNDAGYWQVEYYGKYISAYILI